MPLQFVSEDEVAPACNFARGRGRRVTTPGPKKGAITKPAALQRINAESNGAAPFFKKMMNCITTPTRLLTSVRMTNFVHRFLSSYPYATDCENKIAFDYVCTFFVNRPY